MRRIVTWALSTITTVVLLMSYHTSTSSTASTVNASGTTAGGASKGATGSSGTSKGTTGGSSNGSGSSADGTTFAGAAVPTRFGNVQVQITVVDRKITAASVLQIPNRHRKDGQINNRTVPITDAMYNATWEKPDDKKRPTRGTTPGSRKYFRVCFRPEPIVQYPYVC